MGKIIAIANQKGGVGKTTTSINLSSSLAHFGKKVLLIDMDPQGNSGRGLGVDVTLLRRTIYECLNGELDPNKAIIKTHFDGLKILPSNLRLSAIEAKIYQEPVEEPFALLKKVIGQISEEFDYIIIDCPPSLGLLSLNALTAATSVLVPVQCEYFAMEGVAAMLSTIMSVQKKYNPDLSIEGFLLTMRDSKAQLGEEVAAEIRRLFKENTFLVAIPRNQSIAESQARQVPVTVFRPTSAGSTAYINLAKEVLDHEER